MRNWMTEIDDRQKEFMKKLYSSAIAHNMLLWAKFAPKNEKYNVDLIYNDVVESNYIFSEEEIKKIKKEALEILEKEY